MRWLVVVLVVLLTASVALAYTQQQATHGKAVFTKNCAGCHGKDGHGGPVPKKFPQYAGMQAPPVAGPGALPGMQTAGQVYDFIKKNMPLHKPGSLSDKDYIDIVAFDLQANHVAKPDKTPLTPENAKNISLTKGGGAGQ